MAAGIFHTHNHVADGRIETLIAVLALMGASADFLQQIDQCKTTEAAMELITQAGLEVVYQKLALRVKDKVEQLSKFTKNPIQADAVLCSMDGKILGSSKPLNELIKEFSE